MVGVDQPRERAGEEGDAGADRDEVEDAAEVVDTRVVRSLLVARVEAVEASGDHPEREHEQEEQPLPLLAHRIQAPRRGSDELGQEESAGQANDVGREQNSAHQPTAAVGSGDRGGAEER